ncbi:hypothetical protein EV426DRAFT_451617 [Tirmania nivea]|nr:hypothetical protein EV426DRAFT_451617 [Tirmania nivea]
MVCTLLVVLVCSLPVSVHSGPNPPKAYVLDLALALALALALEKTCVFLEEPLALENPLEESDTCVLEAWLWIVDTKTGNVIITYLYIYTYSYSTSRIREASAHQLLVLLLLLA